MNTITVKILTVLLSIFIIITVVSQIWMALDVKYVTETAKSYSSATKETFYGIFVRDEELIKYSGGGSVSYSVSDGSKVANNAVVACIYSSDEDIKINSAIERIEEEISLLESAQSPGTTEAAQPEFMSALIDEEYQRITSELARNEINDISRNRDNYLSLLSIYQIVIGENRNYDERLDSLYQQLNVLKGQRKNPMREVRTDNTGYFVSYTDGYENILNTSNIGELTAERIKEITETETHGGKGSESGTIGKLIDGYQWKMVGIINNSQAEFSGGDSVKLRFATTSDTVTAKVESITDTDNPEESIIVISCEQLTFDLVRRRVERVDMILHDYDGIKVPRSALRFDRDNEKGVFVLVGQLPVFKKIDTVFECDEYLLSKKTSDSDHLSIYDEIIISGVDTEEYYARIDSEAADSEGASRGDGDKTDDSGEKEEIPVYSEDNLGEPDSSKFGKDKDKNVETDDEENNSDESGDEESGGDDENNEDSEPQEEIEADPEDAGGI